MMNFLMFFPSASNPTASIPGSWAFSTDYPTVKLAVASGKNILVPYAKSEGVATTSATAPNYMVGGLGEIVLAENQILAGADEFTSKIVVSGPGGAIELSSNNSRVYNLSFEGPGINSGFIFSRAITTWSTGWKISGCRFNGFSGETGGGGYGGGAVMCIGKGISAGFDYKDGAKLEDCWFTNNKTGINIVQRAEFLKITDSTFMDNHTAISNQAGNNTFSRLNIIKNTVGFKLYTGNNDGHGTMDSCFVNHNTTNLDITDQTLGFVFTGSHFYDGHITIATSNDITFSNCHIPGEGVGNTMTLTNNVANGVRLDALCKYIPGNYIRNITGPDLVIV